MSTLEASAFPSGVVTFLLTDVVCSTEMWDEDPAEMGAALARHDAIIRQAVETFAGQLIKSRGEGDSTFSAFDRPTDAVSAARAAQRALGVEAWTTSRQLMVRMALHTGETLEREGDYFGPTVNRVARLREFATGGQVLLSQSTASLVVDHLPTDCCLRELGTQSLRGLSRPETMHELVITSDVQPAQRAPIVHAQVPLPIRLAPPSVGGFHGRRRELEALHHAWQTAQTGSLSGVFIAGEAGIGKTAIAGEVARHAHGQGASVLYGRCDEDLGIPYQPWVEMLSHLMGQTSKLHGLGERRNAELVHLVPGLGARLSRTSSPGAIDAESERYVLFSAVTAALAEAAAQTPLVLVLDDLQWADKPSLLLLRHLMSQPEALSMMIVGTYRHNEVSVEHPLVDVLAAMRRETNMRRLVLSGLPAEDLVGMVEAASGQPLGGAELSLVHDVYRETDGNPFFAWEILLHLSETGAVTLSDEGRWVLSRPLTGWALPESVREVIGRRAARLGSEVKRVLTMAAVIGRDFSLDVLSAALGEDCESVLDHLERAESAGLIESVGQETFAFEHALIADTFYADLTATRRARLHRKVAEALEVLDLVAGRVGELAHHWIAAGSPGDTERALTYASMAAEQATASIAPQEANRWYSEALNLLATQSEPDEGVRGQLLIGLGEAQLQSGEPGSLRTLLDAAHLAEARGDTPQLVRAALAGTRGMPGVTDPERVAVLDSALLAVGKSDTPARAELLAALASELTVMGDFDRRRELVDDALAVAKRLQNDTCRLHVLNHVIPAIAVPSTLEERLGLTAEAIELADRLEDPVMAFLVRLHRMHAAFESAQPDEAAACLQRMTELAAGLQQPTLQWTATWARSSQLILAGHVEEAEMLATRALQIGGESGQPDAATIYGGQLFGIKWHQGADSEMVDLMTQVAAERPDLPVLHAAVNRLRLEAGRLDEVVCDIETFRAVPHDIAWATAIAVWSEIASRLGDPEKCQVLYDMLSPYPNYVVHLEAICVGSSAHYLGMLAAALGRLDEADRHFIRAQATHTKLQAPFHLARTLVERGRLRLATSGAAETAEGCAFVRNAREIAVEIGAKAVIRRADELLDTKRCQGVA